MSFPKLDIHDFKDQTFKSSIAKSDVKIVSTLENSPDEPFCLTLAGTEKRKYQDMIKATKSDTQRILNLGRFPEEPYNATPDYFVNNDNKVKKCHSLVVGASYVFTNKDSNINKESFAYDFMNPGSQSVKINNLVIRGMNALENKTLIEFDKIILGDSMKSDNEMDIIDSFVIGAENVLTNEYLNKNNRKLQWLCRKSCKWKERS